MRFGCLLWLISSIILIVFIIGFVLLISAISSTDLDWQYMTEYNGLNNILPDRSQAIENLIIFELITFAIIISLIILFIYLHRRERKIYLQQMIVVNINSGQLAKIKGRIIDDRVSVFSDMKPNAQSIGEITSGTEFELGTSRNINGTIWWEVTIPDVLHGYTPGPFKLFRIRKVTIRTNAAKLYKDLQSPSSVGTILNKGDELYVTDVKLIEKKVWLKVHDIAGNNNGFISLNSAKITDGQGECLNVVLVASDTELQTITEEKEPKTVSLILPGFISFILSFLLFSIFLSGFHAYAIAAGIAGIITGILAGKTMRGALYSLLCVAIGTLLLLLWNYRMFTGPSEQELAELSFWNSFGEALTTGGTCTAITGAIAGAIINSIKKRN